MYYNIIFIIDQQLKQDIFSIFDCKLWTKTSKQH